MYKSVNGTNNARPNDSKKTGIYKKQQQKKKKKKKKKKTKKKQKKKRFLPQIEVFFQNTGKILCLMKTILYHTESHATSTFIRVKDTQIWPEK